MSSWRMPEWLKEVLSVLAVAFVVFVLVVKVFVGANTTYKED